MHCICGINLTFKICLNIWCLTLFLVFFWGLLWQHLVFTLYNRKQNRRLQWKWIKRLVLIVHDQFIPCRKSQILESRKFAGMQMLHLSLSPVWGMNFNMQFGTDLISSALPWVNLQFRLCSSLQWFLCDFSHSLMPLFAMGLSSSRCLQAVLLYSICFDKPSGFNRSPKRLPSHSLSLWQPPVPSNPACLSPWVRDSYFSMEVLTRGIKKEAAYRTNGTLLV